MLIINADDLGKNEKTTDRIIECFQRGVITSASAMVFMIDSARAAELSIKAGIETGLHLNLTLTHDCPKLPYKLREQQQDLVRYYQSGKLAQLIYNPLLKKKTEYVFSAQYDEYCRIFAKEPAKIDGHHHAHLFMNMIVGSVIPRHSRVRRNFTFSPGEKNPYNRLYRRCVDSWLQCRYCCTDSFFSLEPEYNYRRLKKIMDLSLISIVELAVHPENEKTYSFILDALYRDLKSGIINGTYSMI